MVSVMDSLNGVSNYSIPLRVESLMHSYDDFIRMVKDIRMNLGINDGD